MLTAKGLRCELLDGRCGRDAVTTVAGVHACEEHGAALRRIVARRHQREWKARKREAGAAA